MQNQILAEQIFCLQYIYEPFGFIEQSFRGQLVKRQRVRLWNERPKVQISSRSNMNSIANGLPSVLYFF